MVLYFNFPVLRRLKALCSSFYLEVFKLEKKIERKPKCRFIGRKKNEGRDLPDHFNTAHWIMCSELNLCKRNTTKPLAFPLAKSEPLTNPRGLEAHCLSLFLKKECLPQPN